MDKTNSPLKQFSQEDILALDVELKIGIMGTVTPEGLPHLTMISSLMPCASQQMVFGQFTEGTSKGFILDNPKVGFLLMTLDKEMWRGKASYTHRQKHGPEHEKYNNQAMFRYNAYFGVHTVYYLDLVEHYGREPLPMGKVVRGAVQTMAGRIFSRRKAGEPALNYWTQTLFNKVDNLKFAGYVDSDGYPVALPVVQAQALNSQEVIFSLGAYGEEIQAIPAGKPLAVFAMTFDMEDVLLRGTYLGVERVGGVRCGVLRTEWVYNPMPPKPQQIYPPLKVEAVEEF
jgi:hypothetical protein